MKFNIRFPKRLHYYFLRELVQYRSCLKANNLQGAWAHLERAHILGQAYPWPHSYAHWLMLKFGFRIKDAHEIIGQLPRLLVGGLKSFVGKVPVGNTGGANVPPLRAMRIPEDIQKIFSGNI